MPDFTGLFPCAQHPEAWDLDALSGDPRSAMMSLATCLRCPRPGGIGACQTERDAALVRPRAVIWAGQAFNDNGSIIPVAKLAEHLRRRRAPEPGADVA